MLLSDGVVVAALKVEGVIGDGYCSVLVAVRGGLIVVELDRRKETEEMEEASSDKKTKKDGRMTSDQDLPYAEEVLLFVLPIVDVIQSYIYCTWQRGTHTHAHITWSHISHHANYFVCVDIILCSPLFFFQDHLFVIACCCGDGAAAVKI